MTYFLIGFFVGFLIAFGIVVGMDCIEDSRHDHS